MNFNAENIELVRLRQLFTDWSILYYYIIITFQFSHFCIPLLLAVLSELFVRCFLMQYIIQRISIFSAKRKINEKLCLFCVFFLFAFSNAQTFVRRKFVIYVQFSTKVKIERKTKTIARFQISNITEMRPCRTERANIGPASI